MADIQYKTTFTLEEVEEKKKIYLDAKQSTIDSLNKIVAILENIGEDSFSGDLRKEIKSNIEILGDNFFDKLDQKSFNYFEAKNNVSLKADYDKEKAEKLEENPIE